MAELLFKKDGSLIKIREFYNEESNAWESSEKDVTFEAWFHLNNEIRFEDGITLRHFFELINKNIDILVGIFGNWIDEYTDVILNGLPEPKDEKAQPIDYLRVYWRLEIDDKDEELCIPSWPDFDGFGIASHDDDFYKKGDSIKWGVSLSPMQNYAELPLILDETVEVWYPKQKETKKYNSNKFTLYQVIQGIIWEISFHGSPKNTETFVNGLQDKMERIKSGEEKTYPLEDLIGGLDMTEKESSEYDEGFRHYKKLFEM